MANAYLRVEREFHRAGEKRLRMDTISQVFGEQEQNARQESKVQECPRGRRNRTRSSRSKMRPARRKRMVRNYGCPIVCLRFV
ncbi:hypothetical protein WN55_08524 [Dufourea novaeangliae]|uniref:Uncharacterized protein n=1 Tax=Dufourea novaeangliae TaxID=178035 RepID=A0A154P5L1_DUFNO|nr:hypothetical protein WN55_08524 [Dufourea novaeangliae]